MDSCSMHRHTDMNFTPHTLTNVCMYTQFGSSSSSEYTQTDKCILLIQYVWLTLQPSGTFLFWKGHHTISDTHLKLAGGTHKMLAGHFTINLIYRA